MAVDEKQAREMAAIIEACTCTTLRKASRVVTSLFDQAFEPTGLKSTQLAVLLAAAVHGPTTIRELAEASVMDPSSLSRARPRLEEMGLVQKTVGTSKRTKMIEVTETGLSKILEAGPYWEIAQQIFVEAVGEEDHPILLEYLNRAISVDTAKLEVLMTRESVAA